MNAFERDLAGWIQSLLDTKHAMGLPYEASECHLWAFDIMCAQHYPGQKILSREMAMAWVVQHPDEHVNGQMRRNNPIRIFTPIESYVHFLMPPTRSNSRRMVASDS